MTDNNTVPEHCYSFSTFPIIFFSTCVANHLKYRIELSHVNFVFIENVIATFSRCNDNFTYETFFKLTLLNFALVCHYKSLWPSFSFSATIRTKTS